eukprot:TRINITY_DN3870_c0_g1_i1.p1 TRINITY_DN3870_c0_g1~~TRINITY_DN3870_c0_g1_i1.p1  ORF type:complete len:308 (-),score=72.12 TRINITY_DN3870_c0_g1_i1:77-1000(-)
MSVTGFERREENRAGMYVPVNIFYVDNDSPFSSGSKHSFVIRGLEWPTTEHYFQAQKFHNTSYEEQIRTANTVGRAKKLGNDRKLAPIKNWAALMDSVMKEALFSKIVQNPELTTLLLQTGSRPIVKKTNSDYYWGAGASGSGENKFGQILMQIREEIRSAEREGKTVEVQLIEWDANTGWEETKKHRASTRDKKIKKRVKVKARRTNERQGNEQAEDEEMIEVPEGSGDEADRFEGNEFAFMDISDVIREVEQNIEVLLCLSDRESRILLGEQKDKVGALILQDSYWTDDQRCQYFALVDRLDKLL